MSAIPSVEPYPLPAGAELPTNIASWQVDRNRAVLLVHDMQRYFLAAYPDEQSPKTELVANVHSLIAAAREHEFPIAYTAQPGSMTAEQRGLLTDFWGPGMRAEPTDRAIIEPLAPLLGDWVLTKWRYSAFVRSDLLARMRALGRDQLVVCGLYAHVGVLATTLDGFNNDLQTFIVADAVADFSRHQHLSTIEYAAQCCAVVLTAAQVQEQLARVPQSAERA